MLQVFYLTARRVYEQLLPNSPEDKIRKGFTTDGPIFVNYRLEYILERTQKEHLKLMSAMHGVARQFKKIDSLNRFRGNNCCSSKTTFVQMRLYYLFRLTPVYFCDVLLGLNRLSTILYDSSADVGVLGCSVAGRLLHRFVGLDFLRRPLAFLRGKSLAPLIHKKYYSFNFRFF